MSEMKEIIAVTLEPKFRGIGGVGFSKAIADEVAAAALRAIEQAGCAIVPKEPTEAMLNEGPLEPYMDKDVWRAMCEAAPKHL